MAGSPKTQPKPKILSLGDSTYITKVNGRLVMVREKKPSALEIGLDLLGEAFGRKLIKDSPDSVSESVYRSPTMTAPSPFHYPCTAPISAPPQMDPPVEGDPPPGIYQCGNQQLALLPVGSVRNETMQQQFLPYSSSYPYSDPWMRSQWMTIQGYGQHPHFTAMYPAMQASQMTSTTAAQPLTGTAIPPLCAGCGRVRSRKYQHEHPLKSGETHPPSFCRKCQKQDTSTELSCSGERQTRRMKEGERIGGKKKRERRHRSHTKCDSVEGLSKESENSAEKEQSRIEVLFNCTFIPPLSPDPNADIATKQPKEEDILVDEWRGGVRRSRRRPSRRRIDTPDSASIPSHSLSPLFERERPERGRSVDHPLVYRYTRNASPVKVVERPIEAHQDKQRPARRQKGAQTLTYASAYTDNEDGVRRGRSTQSRDLPGHYCHTQRPRMRSFDADDEYHPSLSTQGSKYDDRDVEDSFYRSRRSSNRRRFERLTGESETDSKQHMRPSYLLDPRSGDEVVVVTERYVYRPRHPSSAPEQEDREEMTKGIENRSRRIVAEVGASRHYREDGDGRMPVRRFECPQSIHVEDLRFPVASVGSRSSKASHDVPRFEARLDSPFLPEVSSPRGIMRKKRLIKERARSSRYAPASTPSEDKELGQEGYEASHESGERIRVRCKTTSHDRQPYVCEASDSGLERALIPSPGRPRVRQNFRNMESDMTLDIDRPLSRHVKFRSDGDPPITRDEWLPDDYATPNPRDSSEDNWDSRALKRSEW
ncbi:MAG: hypothetical protein M1818_000783 [Claussenomyces sp. TS43310]|nr:MAG: hypothetical protein M1818_000783 [Claussenomyces sp. TS43310]